MTQPIPNLPEDYHDKLSFLHQLLQHKVDSVDKALVIVNAKIAFLFAFSGAFTTWYVDQLMKGTVTPLSFYPSALRMIVLTLLLGVLVALIKAAQLRPYRNAPHVSTLHSKPTLVNPLWVVKKKTLADISKSYSEDFRQLEQIALWFSMALWTLLASIVIAVIVLLVWPIPIK